MIRSFTFLLALATIVGLPAPSRAETKPAPVAVESPPPRAPRAPRSPRAPRAPQAPRHEEPLAARLLPSGWIGVGLSCEACGLLPGERTPVWSFTDFPVISYVDAASPAAQAGLARGDLLTHVNGVLLVSEDGGRLFGAMQPGQALRLGIRRGDAPRVIIVTPRERPDREAALRVDRLREELSSIQNLENIQTLRSELLKMRERLDQTPSVRVVTSRRQRLRYSGTVGSSDVVVRGLGTVTVSKDEATGELTITTHDATVLIRPPSPPQRR